MTRWVFPENQNISIKGPSGVPVSILRILKERGIEGDEAVMDFLSPTPKSTHDPFLLPDLKEAVDLMLKTAAQGRRICIYGDYDADGVTSVSLLLSVLRRLTDKVCYYIPSRFKDGYGLNNRAIKAIADEGTALLVTVDCGSTSPNEVAYAKELGMDVIVTDHHTPCEGSNPSCLFVNPKRGDSRYPFRELSGCGVAFKLAQGIQRTLANAGDRRFSKTELNELLDLVAISTVADVVPLLDENRTLVKYGLDRINRRERPGLNALLKVLEFEGKTVESEHIGYIIAPNINALGRMHSASLGAELLCGVEKSREELSEMALKMLENNKCRKAEQERATAICNKVMDEGESGDLFPIIYAEGAHEGVTGIVAGSLKETLYRPVFVVTPCEDGLLKGTGRSVPGINLHEIISETGELFIRYGGHAGACGFTMKAENLKTFRDKMQESMRRRVTENPELLEEHLYVEKELSADEKTLDFARTLQQLEPYGEGNPKPLFCMRHIRVRSVYTMGLEEQHVKFQAEDENGILLTCILFRRSKEFTDILCKDSIIDVVGELSVNEFNGSSKVQMIIKDIKRSIGE